MSNEQGTMIRTVRPKPPPEGDAFGEVQRAEVRGAMRGLWKARGTRTRLVLSVRGATVIDLQRLPATMEREPLFDGADISVSGGAPGEVIVIVQRRDESAAWVDRRRGVRGGR